MPRPASRSEVHALRQLQREQVVPSLSLSLLVPWEFGLANLFVAGNDIDGILHPQDGARGLTVRLSGVGK